MAINSQPEEKTIPPEPKETLQTFQRRRVRTGLIITFLGYLMFLMGTSPGLFGLDRSPVIGFIQIAMFLVGLGIICVGGYSSFIILWKERPRSIACPADAPGDAVSSALRAPHGGGWVQLQIVMPRCTEPIGSATADLVAGASDTEHRDWQFRHHRVQVVGSGSSSPPG